jgi:predicted P-loop ATPase
MVARIYHPGCQLDTMVVLEGGQGIFKSQSMKAIGGKWFSEVSTSVDKTDFYQILHGNILLEIAEMNSFGKADITKIKQIISCQTDRYRAPYARGPENHPRMSIFVGTTNESHWMKDHTGGRRFWPIKCRNIDLPKIKAEREQLFAEAIVRFKSGADWYTMPKERTLEEQEQRREVDEWQDRVEDYVSRAGNPGYCTVTDVAENGLKIEIKNVDARVQRRIAAILSVIGWEKCVKRYGNKLKRVWRPKIGGNNDLFVEDVQDFGIEGAEENIPLPEESSSFQHSEIPESFS